MNITQNFIIFQPTMQCKNWCISSFKANYNNIDLIACFIIILALIFILLYEFLNETEKFKPYAPKAVYIAKLLIYIFFFYYFAVIRTGLYLYVG